MRTSPSGANSTALMCGYWLLELGLLHHSHPYVHPYVHPYITHCRELSFVKYSLINRKMFSVTTATGIADELGGKLEIIHIAA